MDSGEPSEYERDSVAVVGGIIGSVISSSNDGRFIFALGERDTVDETPADDQVWTKFPLDVIDLFLSKRTRIDCFELMADSDNFFLGFYAIDEKTVVIVESSRIGLKQYLISIDHIEAKAECILYRTHAMIFNDAVPTSTVGENTVVVTAWDSIQLRYTVIVLPKLPHSPVEVKDYSSMVNEANSELQTLYNPTDPNATFRIARKYPIIISSFVLGFFIKFRIEDEDYYDIMNVLVLDLTTGLVYLQPTSADSSNNFYDKLFMIESTQCNDREMFLMTYYEDDDGEEVYYADEEEDGDTVASLLVFNTKTLEFAEVKEEIELVDYGGESIAYIHMVYDTGSRRMINSQGEEEEDGRDGTIAGYRLIRNPRRVPSLSHLSSIAVQKNGRRFEEMKQIGIRFV